MHNDDRPVGRFLSRRQALTLFGAATAGAALTASAGAPTATPVAASSKLPDCVALPAQTEGPYFVDERLERSDIRVDPSNSRVCEGTRLDLDFVLTRVTDSGSCVVLPGAMVDVWHCDAAGVYSDVRDRNFDTTGQQFLRGYQVSNGDGVVRFTTVYPGWYPGRAVHIHFKIRVPGESGRTDEFTSQLYFDDGLSDRVHARAPYNAKKGQRLLNARDMIFRDGGTRLVLPVVDSPKGLAATYRIAMHPGAGQTRGGQRR